MLVLQPNESCYRIYGYEAIRKVIIFSPLFFDDPNHVQAVEAGFVRAVPRVNGGYESGEMTFYPGDRRKAAVVRSSNLTSQQHRLLAAERIPMACGTVFLMKKLMDGAEQHLH